MINFFLSSFLIIIIIILYFFQVSKFHGGKRDKRYVSNFYESRISISAIVLINHKGFHVYKLNPVILNKILLQQSKMYNVYSIGFWWGRIIGNRNINIFVLFLPSSFFKYLILQQRWFHLHKRSLIPWIDSSCEKGATKATHWPASTSEKQSRRSGGTEPGARYDQLL